MKKKSKIDSIFTIKTFITPYIVVVMLVISNYLGMVESDRKMYFDSIFGFLNYVSFGYGVSAMIDSFKSKMCIFHKLLIMSIIISTSITFYDCIIYPMPIPTISYYRILFSINIISISVFGTLNFIKSIVCRIKRK